MASGLVHSKLALQYRLQAGCRLLVCSIEAYQAQAVLAVAEECRLERLTVR